jgi:hypothetical protein
VRVLPFRISGRQQGSKQPDRGRGRSSGPIRNRGCAPGAINQAHI